MKTRRIARYRDGRSPAPASRAKRLAPAGQKVPRISRLMALPIGFDQLIKDGIMADYVELARLGHVSRARVTHIMNLLNLAPDIQEDLLFSQHSCRNVQSH